MKKIRTIVATFAAVVAVSACSDTADLEKRIDEIDARVTALESVTAALNENVAALQAIAEGKTINKVEEKDGVYTITLSDGTELKLNQGTEGMGKAPLLSIDEDGYWMADYQDGNGPQYILSASDEKVIGRGQNGVTPKFSVNTAGNWTVSYDGGKSWTEVLDENGKAVKAVAEGGESDSYFANVEYTDEALILTLKNGESYTAPVVGGFLFKISGAPDGDVTFKRGEKKTFSIEQKGVVAATVTSRPNGWEAWLSESILTVQAPSETAADTKATIADSRKDVSITAISGSGHVAIAKISVYLDGSATVDDPAAGIKVVGATASTLTFGVTLENTSTWHYIFRKTSETAPSRVEVISSGTEGGDNYNLTFEELSAETSYTLYVVPSNTAADGPLASCEASTTSYSDLYEAWECGQDIKIGGVVYNKSVYGGATLVKESTAVTEAGIYFISTEGEVTVNNAIIKGSVMFIGNNPDVRSSVRIISGADYYLGDTETATHHVIAFKNVSITNENLTRRIMSTATSALGRVVLDNCYLGLNEDLLWRQKEEQTLEDMTIVDCDILVMNDKDGRGRTIIQTWNGSGYTLGSFTAKNNVVWSNAEARQFHFIDAFYASGIEFASVDVENNTLYNVIGDEVDNNRGVVTVNKVTGDLTIKNNLIYQSAPVDKGTSGESRLLVLSTKGEDRELATINTGSNWSWYPYTKFYRGQTKSYFYGTSEGTALGMKLNGNSIESIEEPFESADVTTGTFVKKASFSEVGAQR